MNKFKIYILIIMIFLTGCGSGNSTPSVTILSNLNATDTNTSITITTSQNTNTAITNTDYSLHGRWIYINSGDEFEIYSNSLISYEKIDEDLIKVLQNDNSYKYAMRAGTSKAKATGSVEFLSNARNRSSNRIAGINVILENLKDLNTRSVVKTDENGTFKTKELPAGDYKVIIQDIEQNITINEELQELGTYAIVGKEVNNFRVSLKLNQEFIYADNNQYSGKIIVENISDSVSIGLSYDIELSDSSLKHFNKKIVLGSILAKAKKEIPISFRFDTIQESVKSIPLKITIKDINGLTWTEVLNLKLYRDKFYINIQSNTANVKGYVILPFSDKVIKIDTKSTSITLPKVKKDYKVLLSNPAINEESTYSIAVQRSAILTTNFNDPANSEPNNSLADAKTLNSGEVIESYMHLGDLDYWIIHVKDDYISSNTTSYTAITSNGVYSDNGSFYYINLHEDSYVDITQSTIKYYDINLKFLGYINSDTNKFLQAGEYLVKLYTPNRSFMISSFGLSYKKEFEEIKTNGLYSDNGSYYYINFTRDSYVNITTSDIAYYDINLKFLGSVSRGTNKLFPAGEYLMESYNAGNDFSIESTYFN